MKFEEPHDPADEFENRFKGPHDELVQADKTTPLPEEQHTREAVRQVTAPQLPDFSRFEGHEGEPLNDAKERLWKLMKAQFRYVGVATLYNLQQMGPDKEDQDLEIAQSVALHDFRYYGKNAKIAFPKELHQWAKNILYDYSELGRRIQREFVDLTNRSYGGGHDRFMTDEEPNQGLIEGWMSVLSQQMKYWVK